MGIATVLLSACGGSSVAAPTSYAGKTIALGALLSLTGAGAIYGSDQKKGIDLAVETVNQAGVNGGKISVEVRDDSSDPAVAATAAQALIKDKQVVALVGPTLTFVASSLNPAVEAKHTPILAISETGKHVVGDCLGRCTYVFRDCLGEAAAIPANIKTAAKRSHPRQGVILYAGDYTPSVEARDLFKQAFADNGIAVTADGAIQFSKHDTDFKALVTGALALKPDILAISGLADRPAAIVTEARGQGYAGLIVGDDSFNNYASSQQAGKAGVGAQSASGYWVGSNDGANQSFVDAYKAKYKDSKGNPELPDELAAQAYSAVLILAEAARGANLTLTDVARDRASMRAALERVSLATPLGQFSFTTAHDSHQPVWVNAMDGKGGFVNLTSVAAG